MRNNFLASLLIFSIFNSFAQDNNEILKIVASDRAFVSTDNSGQNVESGKHQYGNSISIDGNYAVIGAWREGEGTLDPTEYEKYSGAIYILERDTNGLWTEKQKVVASNGVQLAFFGFSVSISGDYIIVGAPGTRTGGNGEPTDSSYGTAYIFERNLNSGIWEEKQILHGINQQSISGASTSFSTNVTINGENAVVEDVYFKRDPDGVWREKSILPYKCPKSIFGDLMVIGCELDDTDENGNNNKSNAGAAFIMELENDVWIERQKIVASDRQENDFFGGAVSMDNDYIALGAKNQNFNVAGNTAYDNSGAAYVFKKQSNNMWTEVQKVVASDRFHSDQFGNSISLNGDKLLIGSHNQDAGNLNSSGAAYVFKKDVTDTWNELAKLTASDKQENDKFGSAVAIDNDDIIISAPLEDSDETGNNIITNTGSVYVYSYSGVLSVDNYSNDESILLYPNPSSDKLYVKLNRIFEEGSLSITNVIGKQILQQKVLKNNLLVEVDISNIKQGVYFVTIISDSRKMKHVKFIKN